MSYAILYAECQKERVHVRRNVVRDKVLKLNGLNRIPLVRTSLDTSVCRGFYASATNKNHRIVEQFGSSVVVVARGLNRCWERFVYVKELMHVFDGIDEATDSGEKFESMLEELVMPTFAKWSPQMMSEMKCFWRAMGALCPENIRLEMAEKRTKGQIDDYGIALAFRIPQQYVRHMFEVDYPARIKESMT